MFRLVIPVLFVSVVLLISFGSFSPVFFFLLILVFGLVISSFLANSKAHVVQLQKLWLTALVFYSLLAVFHYYEHFYHNEIPNLDEFGTFIPLVKESLKYSTSNALLFAQTNGIVGCPGFLTYIFLWARIETMLFGEFCEMNLFYSTILLACLYVVFLFKLLQIYVDVQNAYKYTIYYLFFSPLILYSFPILRDLHIALLYLIGFYLLKSKHSFQYNISFLIIIVLLLTTFRFENAIFFSGFVLYYVYNKYKHNKVVLISIAFLALPLVFSFLYLGISESLETVDAYQEYTMSRAAGGGLSSRILSLPTPIKQVATTLLSQIFPIPPWASFEEVNPQSFPAIVMCLLMPIKTVFWFYVAYSLVRYFNRKNNRYLIIKEFGPLLLLALVYVIACSSEYYEVRRLMAVYPLFYLVYVILRIQPQNQILNRTIRTEYLLGYGGLILCFTLAFRLL